MMVIVSSVQFDQPKFVDRVLIFGHSYLTITIHDHVTVTQKFPIINDFPNDNNYQWPRELYL